MDPKLIKALEMVLAGMKSAAMQGKASHFAPKAPALEVEIEAAPEKEDAIIGGDVSSKPDDEDELEALLSE